MCTGRLDAFTALGLLAALDQDETDLRPEAHVDTTGRLGILPGHVFENPVGLGGSIRPFSGIAMSLVEFSLDSTKNLRGPGGFSPLRSPHCVSSH